MVWKWSTHCVLAGEYDLKIISGTHLGPFADKWFFFSGFKSISMDGCFIISRNAASNILQYLNLYFHRLVSNFSRTWSQLEAVGYIFKFFLRGGRSIVWVKPHCFFVALLKIWAQIILLFVPLSLDKSSRTSTSVYECPKPEIAKNEEIDSIFACSGIIFLTLSFLSFYFSLKDVFKIKELSKQRTEEKT